MKRVYLHNAVTIAGNGMISGWNIDDFMPSDSSTVTEPSYKEIIPPLMLRRMSKITRMGMGASLSVNKEIEWEGISVGMSLGNLNDTLRFMNQVNSAEGGMIPPTHFIHSGHNTLSGQIALVLKNGNYNMTHVQGAHSFVRALEDACMLIQEGKAHVLTGGCDEFVPELSVIAQRAGLDDGVIERIGEGTTFFHLSSEPSSIEVLYTAKHARVTDVNAVLETIESKHRLEATGRLMVAAPTFEKVLFPFDWNIADYAGYFLTNDAPALHLAGSALLSSSDRTHAWVMHPGEDDTWALHLIRRV